MIPAHKSFDLLQAPLVGQFLRWRHSRSVLQSVMLLLAALVLYDGFFGPQLAPKNVAGTLPWVQWRGFLVLALLIGGNFFCMACPFMLPRRLAKALLPANRSWPKRLRSKWLAIGLLALFFWTYEAFDLWASPWLTAWVALAYFATAFVVDGCFKGAAFCKYVCPIGQFNFVNSLASPLEVRVRSLDVCTSCTTKDCIKGRTIPLTLTGQAGETWQSGCELWLFQERKAGNMDCTFCLDCVHACPHDNVGILARTPTSELWADPRRSGVGLFGRRTDLAGLVLLLVFGAFMNAFGMVGPVYGLEEGVAKFLGTRSEPVVLAVIFGLGLFVLPAVLVGAASWLTKLLTRSRVSVLGIATRYSYSLVPMGFGMWLAHYGYHFMTGGLTFVPVMQSFLSDFGIHVFGNPRWGLATVVPDSWLFPIEVLALQLGVAGSLWTAYHIAEREGDGRAWRGFTPWAVLACLLFVAGIWLMLQPMQMRGTLNLGG